MKVATVIPARYASTRLPGKPLLEINGKPMIQWVYERAALAAGVHTTVVATDDERIVQAVQAFGGNVVMTGPGFRSGTDRVAAVAKNLDADVIVNVQGDEPLIQARAIDRAVELVASRRFSMGTLMTAINDEEELLSRNVVKVLSDNTGRVIYFSRLPVPYGRERGVKPWISRRHIGLYVYSKEVLQKLSGLPPSRMELAEGLEQLRALENGISIGAVEIECVSIGVDTQADLEKVRRVLK